MTLPFRRRHHDDESGHDRARAIWSAAMLESVAPADEAWLEGHLAGCGECRIEHEAYLADRALLRSLRDNPPEPPRDLWARTAAAIERESGVRTTRGGRRVRTLLPRTSPPSSGRLPLSVLSGVLVVLVVLATSLVPRVAPVPGAGSTGSAVAVASPQPVATPLTVAVNQVLWLQGAGDGTYQLSAADVDQVCPNDRAGCAPLEHSGGANLTLGSAPQSVVLSPSDRQLVVVSRGSSGSAGSVVVVALPAASAISPPPASGAAATTSSQTGTGTPTPRTTPSSTTAPTTSPSGSAPAGSPTATPAGSQSILSGVQVVGETAYSDDGRWLAFSARPMDESLGPDLYVWHVGEPSAVAVTHDHRTFFSSWLGNQILASRVALGPGAPVAPSPGASVAGAPGSPVPSVIGHPVSFLFDPMTGASTEFTVGDVWLPTVDASGRLTAYWSGTLVLDAHGTGWLPGTGSLVLDRWQPETAALRASAESSQTRGAIGPAGTPIDLVSGPLTAFQATFDPTGTRLAIWIAAGADAAVGTLQLLVLDPKRGIVDPALAPLPGVPALRGYSMDRGRLAWVSPPGQNGQESSVEVLAWSNDSFGQVETVPGNSLTIVH